MKSLDRRSFLAGASLAIVAGSKFVTAANPSKIKVALIGCGGRAGSHRDEFSKIAQVAWVCDPDKKRLAEFEKATGAKSTTDMRRIFDDKDVQAVVVSTPDHWHAPASILACNAGKHVYVEKPCSHNFIEGAMLVQAIGAKGTGRYPSAPNLDLAVTASWLLVFLEPFSQQEHTQDRPADLGSLKGSDYREVPQASPKFCCFVLPESDLHRS